MDVGELLLFKPVPTPKGRKDLEGSDDESKGSKNARRSKKSTGNRLHQISNKSLPKEPVNDFKYGEILDDTAVKKLVLNFEKKALRNREMRIKFPDQPEKFMESEIDLFDR